MGIILGRAATMAGYTACQTQNYGTESRGGYCRAMVVVEKGEARVGSPVLESPNYLVAFSQAAYNTYRGKVGRAVVFYDPDLVQEVDSDPGTVLLPVPATVLAKEKLGSTMAANAVMLGRLVREFNRREEGEYFLPPEAVKTALSEVFSNRFRDANLRGFDLGYGGSDLGHGSSDLGLGSSDRGHGESSL